MSEDKKDHREIWPTDINKICNWIDHLETKNKSFTSVINNGFLLKAMKALLLIESLSAADLSDYLLEELEKTSNPEREGVYMLYKISELFVKNIQENMNL